MVWLRLLITALISKINLYEVMFAVVSNIKVPFVRRIKSNQKQLKILESTLRHGDLLFGRRDLFLKNAVVRGRYKHVGVWDAERKVVLEMQDKGYQETPLEIFLSRYTEVAVGRCVQFSIAYAKKFVRNMRSFSDKDYDSRFSMNTTSMYCSESVHYADSERRLEYHAEQFFWLVVFMPDTLLRLPTVKKVLVLNKKGLKLS